MKHIVSLSGGISSAIAAHRVIERYGKENAILWFADTSWEDEDLYRFLGDLEDRWGIPVLHYKDGRTPLEVCEDVRLIGNQKRAPCTRILKIEPFADFLKKIGKPVTVHLGMSWEEQHRMESPRKNYEAIEGVKVDYPLMWQPWSTSIDMFNQVRSWGIEIPRLYLKGMPHNNCGGRCVKQGIAHWLNLRKEFPERFNEVRDWEQYMRNDVGIDYAICRDQSGGEVKPITLVQIDEANPEAPQAGLFDEPSDMYECYCTF